MSKVIYSTEAKADLQETWDYIAEDSPFQADRLILRVREKLEYLAKWKTMGRPRPEFARGCRSYPFGKYCFYFRPTDTGIEVLRILHSARDLEQISFPK
ncbi:MAG: type II toxin-antitoxin system RelE/ParE family toxin [Verrucomicrobiaceae bacterium]|nr:type II toxin-antitoxin system RelE/ParE family toxin [Verrucomicrobiaceae bacterium]